MDLEHLYDHRQGGQPPKGRPLNLFVPFILNFVKSAPVPLPAKNWK